MRGARSGAARSSSRGQVWPRDRLVRYEIAVRRFTALADGAALAIGDATVLADGEPIYATVQAALRGRGTTAAGALARSRDARRSAS